MKKFILSLGLSAFFLGAMAQQEGKMVGGTGAQISVDRKSTTTERSLPAPTAPASSK
jgi:hypothetical protein